MGGTAFEYFAAGSFGHALIMDRLVNFPRDKAANTYPWIVWDNALSEEELAKITDYCETSSKLEVGKTNDPSGNPQRMSAVCFHSWKPELSWFFFKMNNLIEIINNRWFGFDLSGYEGFQYTEYDEAYQGKYGWHMDLILGPDNLKAILTRKLSFSLCLNEPGKDYEGGEFQINVEREGNPRPVEQKQNRLIAFPSFMLHQVTPITKGKRKSIVIWVVGPKFT